MAPRNLLAGSSVDSHWYEMKYTQARCLADSHAVDLAPIITPHIAEIEEIQLGQRRLWGSEIDAQALCDHLNGQADDLVIDLSNALIFIHKDRKSPRLERYFKQPPYAITRLGLRSEVELIREWPDSLKTEPEELLNAFAPRFDALIQKTDAALLAQRQAHTARVDNRVRVITPLVERLNKTRMKLYGQLVTRAEERNLGKYWPDGFFKVTQRRTTDEAEDPAPVAEPVE